VVTTTATTSPSESGSPPESGARSGALLAGSAFVATGLNYVFLLAAGRILGSDDYGALAALLGLLTVVLLPTGALQLAVSREVSRRIALGDDDGAAGFSRATLRLGLIVTLPLVAVSLAFTIPVREILNIESTGAVALALSGLFVALAFPIAMGVLQGYQRFHAVAAMYVVPFALRLLLLALAAWAGYRLGGAVLAAVAGGIASAVVAVALLRAPLRRGAGVARPALAPFLRYLWPVVVGLIGIAVLTNLDLLVVKARFSDEAGEYAAASAFARVAFFLPATILAVLFPRTAARQARGEDTADILGRTFLVTAAFGGLLALFYAMTGRGLVHTSFGGEFAEGGDYLVPFTISMALFALVNVFVGFHLSRGETRFAWIVAAAVPVQLVVLVLVPNDARGVIWADIVVGTLLLCAHEIFVDTSLPALGAGFSHLAREVSLARRTVVEAVLVLAGSTAFVCVLFWPLVAHFGSSVVGRGSDSSGTVYSFWRWNEEGGYHLFGQTHHTLTGAPFGWDGDNGLNIQWLLPYYPGYLATKVIGEVAAHNLILLAGYVLSGASMYLLVRYLGCARLVAAWAGMVYIVFPWHLERTPHASLVHLEFLPLLLLAMVAAARKPTLLRFVLVGGATLACWLTSGYFGAMAVVAVVVFALGAALVSAVSQPARLLVGSTASAVSATLFVAFLSAISGVGRGSGLQRVADDLEVYGFRPLEFILPASDNFLFGRWLEPFWDDRQHRSNIPETSNYLGLFTLALVVAWIVIAWRRRAHLGPHLRIATAGLLPVAVAAIVLGFPSPVSVFGHEVWMPSRLLWEVVPPFRVPSRWIVMVMAALVPMAAFTLQAGWERLEPAARRWRGIAVAPVALVAVALLVSVLELGVRPANNRIEANDPPAEYTALARTPVGVLAEYPLVQNIDDLFWQRFHHRPVLNSEAFGYPPDEARRTVLHPGQTGTAGKLAFLGVTAIVTHRDALRYTDLAKDVPNASWGAGYELVARTEDGASVWRVVARPEPALVTLHSGFGDPRPPEDREVDFPLLSPSGVGYFELRAKEASVIRMTFKAEPPTGTRRVLRLADADAELQFPLDGRSVVSVVVAVPRGLSFLFVKTDPAATSADDAIDITAPVTENVSGTSQLQAEPISPDIGF
jgi:O-antigen/teichoic acid export membrane protein